MTDLDQIHQLVELGEKSDGEFRYDRDNRSIYRGDIDIIVCERVQFDSDGEFLTAAANARPTLSALLTEVERLRDEFDNARETNRALAENIESQKQTHDALLKKLSLQAEDIHAKDEALRAANARIRDLVAKATERNAEIERLREWQRNHMACFESKTIDGAVTKQCYDPIPIFEQQAAAIKALRDILHDVRDHIDGEIDVTDGSYGEPAPNRAMVLAQEIDKALKQTEELL